MHVSLDRIQPTIPNDGLNFKLWTTTDELLTICIMGDNSTRTLAAQQALLNLGHRVEVCDSGLAMDALDRDFLKHLDLSIILDIKMETLADILIAAPTNVLETPFWIAHPERGVYHSLVLVTVWNLLFIDTQRRRSYNIQIDWEIIEIQLKAAVATGPDLQLDEMLFH